MAKKWVFAKLSLMVAPPPASEVAEPREHGDTVSGTFTSLLKGTYWVLED